MHNAYEILLRLRLGVLFLALELICDDVVCYLGNWFLPFSLRVQLHAVRHRDVHDVFKIRASIPEHERKCQYIGSRLHFEAMQFVLVIQVHAAPGCATIAWSLCGGKGGDLPKTVLSCINIPRVVSVPVSPRSAWRMIASLTASAWSFEAPLSSRNFKALNEP